MSEKRYKGGNRARGWQWKVPLGLLILICIGLAAVTFFIDPFAHRQINRALDRFLRAGGRLEAIHIELMGGYIDLGGLIINTPAGYGSDPLLSLGKLTLDIEWASLLKGDVVAESLTLKEASLVLVRDKNGNLSLARLIKPGKKASNTEPVDDPREQTSPWIPSICVNSIKFEDVSVRVIDQVQGEKWAAGLRLELSANNLQLKDLLNLDILVGQVSLALSEIIVDQPPGFSKTPLLSVDKIELTTPGLDLGNPRLSVSKASLANLTASAERNKNGVINLQQLIDAWRPAASGTEKKNYSATTQPSAGKKAAAAQKRGLPTLVFEDIHLESIALQFLDSIDGNLWRAGFEGLDVDVTGFELGDATKHALSLDSLRLDLKGAAVDQPPGFDSRKLAGLENLTVTAGRLDLASQELVIKKITAQRPTAYVTVQPDGSSNVSRLYKALFDTRGVTGQSSTPPEEDKNASTSKDLLPGIRFEQIQLKDGSLLYRDEVSTEETLVFPIENIQAAVKALGLFIDAPGAGPAAASLSFELEQSGDLPTAFFGSLAVIGPLGDGVPLINCLGWMTGFKLDTFGSLVPPATRATLRAEGFDAAAALSLDRERIKLRAAGRSDQNIDYEGITVHGPLGAPRVKAGPILAGAFGHLFGGALNIGKGGLKAGVEIAKGGVDVVEAVGSGALTVSKGLATSLFKAADGLVTADGGQLKDGLAGSSKGTARLLKESATGAGSAAGGGMKSSVSGLKGEDALQAWNEGIPARYETLKQRAKEKIVKMPYPPVTD